jgi:uncharacterized protein (TIGR02996 family)
VSGPAPEREGLLAALAAAPDDDVPRLVLADYCDERGDPLGEFIRLQMELEPLQRPRAEPAAELERHKRLAGIPPGGDDRDPTDELTVRLAREGDLLCQHKALWLGEAAAVEADSSALFEPEFRRGFVASAQIGLTALRESGAAVRRGCPALQRLIVLGTLGRGEELAACEALAGLPELTLAGWLTREDAEAVIRCPHLRELHSLRLWIGNEDDEAVCRQLARRFAGLHELTLVQLYGGLDVAGDDPDHAAFHDEHADRLAAEFRRRRPYCEVRVERPFTRRFPLDGLHVGYGLNAGTYPDGRGVLANEGRQPVMMYFDDQGRFTGEEQLDFRELLHRPPKHSWEDCNVDELIEVLGREIGFVPGPIFVREFQSQLSEVAVMCWGGYEDEIAAPQTTDPEESEEMARSIYWWYSTSQFVLPFGNTYWADGLGRIHTS